MPSIKAPRFTQSIHTGVLDASEFSIYVAYAVHDTGKGLSAISLTLTLGSCILRCVGLQVECRQLLIEFSIALAHSLLVLPTYHGRPWVGPHHYFAS